MNLSRAKTVLICTFLALNIFLCYQLCQDQGYGKFASFDHKEEISRLESALLNAGLTLETNLPRGAEPVAYMIVKPWMFSAHELIFYLWEALEGSRKTVPEIKHTVRNDEKGGENSVSVYSFGGHKLIVNRAGPSVLNFYFREEEAKKLYTEEQARQLVGSIPFLDDFVPDYTGFDEKGKVLFFRQEYESFPFYAGYIYFSLLEKNPAVQFYRLEVVGFAKQKREVIPSSMALLRFLERYEGSETGESIVDFSLGYYTREYDAQRWEIPPVWRIRLNNGEIYYINAFTGNPEI